MSDFGYAMIMVVFSMSVVVGLHFQSFNQTNFLLSPQFCFYKVR